MLSFPLESITEHQTLQLGGHLWSWQICDSCKRDRGCESPECSSQRLERLRQYFEYYKDLTAGYEPEEIAGTQSALNSHEDLFAIIKGLKEQPDKKRCEIEGSLLGARPGRLPPSPKDRERAINLAIRVMTMVNCSSQRQSSNFLEHGYSRIRWNQDMTFGDFAAAKLPRTDNPSLNEDTDGLSDMKPVLVAKSLQKRAGLKFVPTDDLSNHLKLDVRSGEVQVFHHTAFLKENLRVTRDHPRDPSGRDTLRVGILPRQIYLEALDTIQTILFPLGDPQSRTLLQHHVSTSGFDPDALRFENASIRLPSEPSSSTKYHYFGARLADLYEEAENPTPRGRAQKWFERRSGARYVMMATLCGVIFAVLLGMASLGLGICQAWISYQAWKHPVSPPSQSPVSQ